MEKLLLLVCKNMGEEELLTYSFVSQIDAVSKLIPLCNINYQDEYGFTPLMMVVSHSTNIDIIKILIENGANVNSVNKSGKNALMLACQYKTYKPDVIKILLDNGANANAQDLNGNTALLLGLANKQGCGKESLNILEKVTNVLIQNNKGFCYLKEAKPVAMVMEMKEAKPVAMEMKEADSVIMSLSKRVKDPNFINTLKYKDYYIKNRIDVQYHVEKFFRQMDEINKETPIIVSPFLDFLFKNKKLI